MSSRYEWTLLEITKISELKKFIEDNQDNFTKDDWFFVYKSPAFTLDLLETYPDDLPWASCCLTKKMPQTLMEKYPDRLDWYHVSSFQVFNKEFLDKFVHRMSLPQVVKNERLSKTVREHAAQLMKKYDDPEHHKVWDENLRNCRTLCPKNFQGRYHDYTDKTPLAYEKYAKKTTKSKTKTTTNAKTKNIKKPYEKMTKQELKDILAQRCVKVMYHDTMDILIRKCKESEN